jgi:hypothetical protein
LKLWYDCYQRVVASEVTQSQKAIFDAGHEVGHLARDRYPGGVLVVGDYRHTEQAVDRTAALISDPTVPSIYEAAFIANDVLIRADILERIASDSWRLIEVKSTTRLKEVHDVSKMVRRHTDPPLDYV